MRSLALLLLLLAVAAGQPFVPGPQVLTFLSDVDDSDQPYALYLPRSYDGKRAYPLVITLHGAFSNHRLNLRRVFGSGNRVGESDIDATRFFPRLPDVEFLVASPLARGTMGYQGIPEKDVYDVLADVKRRFKVDDDRVYLTGLSMGGGGTLWLALTRPDVWAAIAPVCPAAPLDTEPLAGNALHLPVKLFQGAIDPVVPAESTRRWHARFTDAGVKSEYVEYPAVRHNAWDHAYRNAAIFEWFSQFRRNRFPQRVRFTSAAYRYRDAYWLRLDRLTPGTLAAIDAKFESRNNLVVTTKDLEGFTLNLEGHPLYSRKAIVSLQIDDAKLRVKAGAPLSFSRSPKGWIARSGAPGSGEKKPAAEGPIGEALSSRHVYVYGTDGAPTKEELERRRAVAAEAADWSTSRVKLSLSFQVLSDHEVTERDLAGANLMLFGTKETNSVIAKLAPDLPLALNPGAADYGLMYVYPARNRYVVINSGLPWQTRIDQVKRGGLSFVPLSVRIPRTFGDYILFRGGLDNVLAEGRFDPNWRLPADAAEIIRATGAVEIHK